MVHFTLVQIFQDSNITESMPSRPAVSQRICKKGLKMSLDKEGLGPSQRTLVEERKKQEVGKDVANTGIQKRHEKVMTSNMNESC